MSPSPFNRFSALRVLLTLSACSLPAIVAAAPTTEAGEANLTDPNVECTPYNYPPVSNAYNLFPPIWGPASIVPGDTAAGAKWAAIQGSVPDIPPKGTLSGDFSGVNYPSSDPDCWWTFSKCTTPKAPGLVPDIAAMPEPQTLGYGFDDGPNCSHNAFYDYLTTQEQKATMFYIGSNVMDWPLEAQRAVTYGHEICVHTWSHHYMTSFASEDAFAELYYTLQAIKLVTGVTPTCWRPPFGDIDDRIRAIANGMGLRTVLWKYDSDDWEFGFTPGITSEDVDNNYQKMIDDADSGLFATAGTIILTHELNNYTMSEAMKFYPLLKKAFANIVPVGVGLNVSHPYLETNYTLPTFAQYVSGDAGSGSNLNSTVNNTTAIATPTTSAAVTSSAIAGSTSGASAHPSGTSAAAAHPDSGAGSARMDLRKNIGAALICLASALVGACWV